MHLFVYGVLIRELAQGRAGELVAPLGPGLRATTRGALYGVEGKKGGFYPILLPDPAGPLVHGALHEADEVDWAGLDAFEDAHDGPGAEYRRCEVPVAIGAGAALAQGGPMPPATAFAYCYARRLPATAAPIAHGDFARWLKETGRAPISER